MPNVSILPCVIIVVLSLAHAAASTSSPSFASYVRKAVEDSGFGSKEGSSIIAILHRNGIRSHDDLGLLSEKHWAMLHTEGLPLRVLVDLQRGTSSPASTPSSASSPSQPQPKIDDTTSTPSPSSTPPPASHWLVRAFWTLLYMVRRCFDLVCLFFVALSLSLRSFADKKRWVTNVWEGIKQWCQVGGVHPLSVQLVKIMMIVCVTPWIVAVRVVQQAGYAAGLLGLILTIFLLLCPMVDWFLVLEVAAVYLISKWVPI